MEMYPHWNARDNYRFGLKKKKRKRDKTDDPGQLISAYFLSFQWHALSKEKQAKYYALAKQERQVHMQLYPGWTARDNYAKHKKKRRKREKIRAGNAGVADNEGQQQFKYTDVFIIKVIGIQYLDCCLLLLVWTFLCFVLSLCCILFTFCFL